MGNTGIIVAALAACACGAAAFAANLISISMINRINAYVPKPEPIDQYRWGSEVRQRFKQLFPGDKLIHWLDFSVIVMLLSFALVIRFWVFG
jgi:hypothetical protein